MSALALGCVACLLVAASHSGAEAAPGATTSGRVTLGPVTDAPPPACPEACRAIGSVSGFQVSIEDPETGAIEDFPYRVPFRRGRVTEWSLYLAQPTNSQKAFFNGTFGQPPLARIGVIRKVRGSSPPRYALKAQSPLKGLTQFFGRRASFKLRKPLPVRRGDVISLTVPTWAPAFAIDIPEGNVWRSSRERGECLSELDQRKGRPHQVVKSRRTYGCKYETAQLLYTARVIRGAGRG